MVKKVIAGFLVLATSTVFGMSLNKLNSASKLELMEINGIGDAKADAIIKERKKGKFKSFKDFERVDGIGESLSSNVKNNKKSKRQDTNAHIKNKHKKMNKTTGKSKKSKGKKHK